MIWTQKFIIINIIIIVIIIIIISSYCENIGISLRYLGSGNVSQASTDSAISYHTYFGCDSRPLSS